MLDSLLETDSLILLVKPLRSVCTRTWAMGGGLECDLEDMLHGSLAGG